MRHAEALLHRTRCLIIQSGHFSLWTFIEKLEALMAPKIPRQPAAITAGSCVLLTGMHGRLAVFIPPWIRICCWKLPPSPFLVDDGLDSPWVQCFSAAFSSQ
ncbi:hypothetical protein C8R45DRAFT_1089763 [Mycena sanguinolenta]|nr:hypothetical protein C8R45DRAFT_1089763 [Mycena sanguinolenta]